MTIRSEPEKKVRFIRDYPKATSPSRKVLDRQRMPTRSKSHDSGGSESHFIGTRTWSCAAARWHTRRCASQTLASGGSTCSDDGTGHGEDGGGIDAGWECRKRTSTKGATKYRLSCLKSSAEKQTVLHRPIHVDSLL